MSAPSSPNSPKKTFGNLVDITHISSNILGNIQTIEGNTQFNTNITVGNITNLTLDQTINGNGFIVVNQQGTDEKGDTITHSTFDTTNPMFDPQIKENLVETVDNYYDDEQNTETKLVLDQIKLYAGKIQCDDFHGKGSIDDYSELFRAASKIANDSKQIKLDVDVDGFNQFADAADELANLFNSFILKLENVSIINDLDFLRAISIALGKIWNLSEVFGKFKQTILATTTVHMPKSAHDTKLLIEGVMTEVNCAMNYINHFVNPFSNPNLVGANLSSDEHNVITQAVNTIDNWNVLCDQGVSIAMSNNPDIQYISNANNELKTKSSTLRTATSNLKAKLALFNINRTNVNLNVSV
jgi:hypothetical protein